MRTLLVVLIVLAAAAAGCVKSAGTGTVGKGGLQASGTGVENVSGFAQLPGGMQSLPSGGPSGGQQAVPPMAQFNLPAQGGQPPSSAGMGQLLTPQEGGRGGGGEPPPPMDLGGKTGAMAGFAQPTMGVAPAFAVTGGFTADISVINVNEAAFLSWKLIGADDLSIGPVNGKTYHFPGSKTGYLFVPTVPGMHKITLTASNKYGSASQSLEINALSAGQRPAYDKNARLLTFVLYPQKIKKGEPVTVCWNVLDASKVYLENTLTNSLTGVPDPRDLVNPYGERQFWPPMDTTFRLTHLNGQFPPTRTSFQYDYHYRDIFVEVR